jgi:ABC-type amino acid transport substrate-binding protein
MLVSASKTGLLEKINSAMATLSSNGTLDALDKKYIKSDNIAQVLKMPAATMPNISGSENVVVGVCGDLPPLDYITPDGKPTGYNAALMAEIAKTVGINVTLLVIESEARFSAIESGRIDMFFWNDTFFQDTDKIKKSNSYSSMRVAALVRK